MNRVHDLFGPLKRYGSLVVFLNEIVDSLAQLLWRGKTSAAQGGADQNAEPAFDHIEPAGVGRGEMKMHVGVTSQPGVVLGLVSFRRQNTTTVAGSYAPAANGPNSKRRVFSGCSPVGTSENSRSVPPRSAVVCGL